MMRYLFSILILMGIFFSPVLAQDKKEKKTKEEEVEEETTEKTFAPDTSDIFLVDPETQVPLTVNLEAEEEEEEEEKDEKKAKKRKRNVFYDIKTKKGYARSASGGTDIIETFHYLKTFEMPDPYVRDVYWYDTKRKQIRTTHNITKGKALILHGPYQKMTTDNEILEEGIFYKGTKHGRWTKYSTKNILLDKEKYTRGWPRESEITYYDEGVRKKPQEVVPVEYGEKEGYYFYFHPSGRIAVEGEYQQGEKVGIWTEFYDYDRRPKKQIKYSDDPYDEEARPYTMKEWSPEGQVVYEYQKPK
uniref:MORN repeat variant n=1 Tax=Roseihalotalea indica TaxID=2867963 RepID=A0AA49JJX8_9BACT|nr:hypothetical protein K4G66_15000 [Tunicatimonas sp. TK19036]